MNMLSKLKALFKGPEPAGPPQTIKEFLGSESTITHDGVEHEEAGWRLKAEGATVFRLFEHPLSDLDHCMLTYRAQLRSENLEGKGYLEMWCRLPGGGEFFSRGFAQTISGTVDWASYETPFYLKTGQKPDLVKLNFVTKGSGVVCIKDIVLLQTPLKS